VPLTRVTPNIIAVANNVINKTVGNSTSLISLTFDGAGVITSASNVALSGASLSANSVANSAFQTGSVESYMRANSLDFGMRNRIINGAMKIDQRNAGSSVTPTTAVYVVDRWRLDVSQSSKFSAQQNAGSVTPPVGFTNYLGTTVVSAFSIGSGDYFSWNQPIEGFNTADLQWGTANAKTVTLSAWVYSSLTGTFGGALQNSATTYSYPFTYSIPTANTWTQINITVVGPTAGTWVGATNGMGLNIYFGLGVGSGYSGTAGSWASANYKSATGATSVVGTNGATFYITGVQLEVGSSATGFEYRQYGQELALCQRYCSVLRAPNDNAGLCTGSNYSSTNFYGNIPYPVTMRSTPSLTVAGTASAYQVYFNGGSQNATSTSLGQATQYSAELIIASSSLTSGNGAFARYGSTAGCVLTFSSEL
jgi:hypothetical protein